MTKKYISKVQLLNIQDYEGKIYSEPLNKTYFDNGIKAGTLLATDLGRPVGGLATLKAYFDFERKSNPNSLLLTAGELYVTSSRNIFRTTNSHLQFKPSLKAMKLLGVNARSISFHDLTDSSLKTNNKFIQKNKKQGIYVTAVGLNDPNKELSDILPYKIFCLDRLKIAYIAIPSPRTSEFNIADPSIKVSRMFWGSGPISVDTDLITLISKANIARIKAEAKGAQVFVLNIHTGFYAVNTGKILLANAIGFDIIYFDNSHQTIAGFNLDGQGRNVLCLAPWAGGVEYSRLSVVYDHKQKKIIKFLGKNNTELIPNIAIFPDFKIMKQVLITAFADCFSADPKMQQLINYYDKKSHKELDIKIATLTKNIFINDTRPFSAVGDSTIWSNLIADGLRAKNKTDISFVNNKVNINGRKLIEKFSPRNTNFSRIEAPYDLLGGDIWDTIYNEVGTNFVSTTSALSINSLFDALEVSVNITPPMIFSPILGISGFTYTYNPNANGLKINSVTIYNTLKTYNRASDGSIANGSDIISATCDSSILLIKFYTNAVYNLVYSANWNPQEYGSLVDAVIYYLKKIKVFDPTLSFYKNRFTIV